MLTKAPMHRRRSLLLAACLALPLPLGTGAAPAGAAVPAGSRIELLPVAGAQLWPREVAVSPDGAHVYSIAEFELEGFARDPDTGVLGVTRIDREEGSWGALAISPDGAHVYAVAYHGPEGERIEVSTRDEETGALEPFDSVGPTTGGTEALDGLTSLAVSPDGAFLYVVCADSDHILVFPRDASTGALDTPPLAIAMPTKPDRIELSPDGAHAYLTSRSDDALRAYSRDEATGELALLDTIPDLVPNADSARMDVSVSPDGTSVWVTSTEETVARFARDAESGALTQTDAVLLGQLGLPPIFGFTPDRLAVVAGDEVAWIARGRGPGLQPTSIGLVGVAALALTPSGEIEGIDAVDASRGLSDVYPTDIALSPDQRHVYFGGIPLGLQGATLVPEPGASSLALAALAALAGLAQRRGASAGRAGARLLR